ncbi:Iron-uptake system-binding protein precursor [Paenibacillus konkukensis]|uniref:Iron-uptake system-binding protein n=1 Tax=Paenibacillus konkukensis TaxID=2020716 RepID=A0ABY4RGV9_9BACL|nr:ABC transporter substrate-binding protein [Paenibacillus konkukensis]UQZ80864.1 Iron-uptake system-binding protein precursor [Paenibacillus konkukensis]
MRGKRTKWSGLTAVIIAAGLAAGCDGSGVRDTGAMADREVSAPNSEASADSFARTIHHLNGDTKIAQRPVNIAVPYVGFVDYLAVLDTYPVAAQGMTAVSRNFPNLNKRLAGHSIMDLGMEVDMEKLLASQPDIIIAADDMSDKYEQLSRIAPTVVLPQAGEWRETLKQIARVIGQEAKADDVLAEFDRKSEQYRAKLAFRSDQSVLFVMYNGKEQFVSWPEERFEPFYRGLGLKPVPGAAKGGTLSLESLSSLRPDHLFVINNWSNPIQGGVKEALKDNKVWNSIEAVKNDRVYYLSDPSIAGPMALAKIDGIEEIVNAMGKPD